MHKFLFGFVIGIVVLFSVMFCYVLFGFVDPRADKEVSLLESKIAMPALDAAVDRRASEAQNPIQPTDANLTAGMKIYQTNCASCHGDIHRPRGPLADSFILVRPSSSKTRQTCRKTRLFISSSMVSA